MKYNKGNYKGLPSIEKELEDFYEASKRLSSTIGEAKKYSDEATPKARGVLNKAERVSSKAMQGVEKARRDLDKLEIQVEEDIRKTKNIGSKLYPLIILASIFFLSPNLTGNVIGSLSRTSSNLIGGILFILGVVGSFISIRKK